MMTGAIGIVNTKYGVNEPCGDTVNPKFIDEDGDGICDNCNGKSSTSANKILQWSLR